MKIIGEAIFIPKKNKLIIGKDKFESIAIVFFVKKK